MPTWKSAGERYLEGEVLSPDMGIHMVFVPTWKSAGERYLEDEVLSPEMGIPYVM